MCPTVVQTAAVAITNGHSVNVAISFETATNTVYISSRFSYVFFLCERATNYSGVKILSDNKKDGKEVVILPEKR